jgi:hypothetical protein
MGKGVLPAGNISGSGLFPGTSMPGITTPVTLKRDAFKQALQKYLIGG